MCKLSKHYQCWQKSHIQKSFSTMRQNNRHRMVQVRRCCRNKDADVMSPLYKCNTNAPGWLKGEHPSVADGQVTRKACFHWSNCCSLSTNIKVRNCGSYYVYYLKSTGSCWYRYCSTHWTEKSSLLTNLIVRKHIVTIFDWKKALSQMPSNNDCISILSCVL